MEASGELELVGYLWLLLVRNNFLLAWLRLGVLLEVEVAAAAIERTRCVVAAEGVGGALVELRSSSGAGEKEI